MCAKSNLAIIVFILSIPLSLISSFGATQFEIETFHPVNDYYKDKIDCYTIFYLSMQCTKPCLFIEMTGVRFSIYVNGELCAGEKNSVETI